MTSDLTRAPDKRYAYSNALAGLVSLVKQEGLQGLARGLGTNTVCFGHFVSKFNIDTMKIGQSHFNECMSFVVYPSLTYSLITTQGIASRIVSYEQQSRVAVHFMLCD